MPDGSYLNPQSVSMLKIAEEMKKSTCFAHAAAYLFQGTGRENPAILFTAAVPYGFGKDAANSHHFPPICLPSNFVPMPEGDYAGGKTLAEAKAEARGKSPGVSRQVRRRMPVVTVFTRPLQSFFAEFLIASISYY